MFLGLGAAERQHDLLRVSHTVWTGTSLSAQMDWQASAIESTMRNTTHPVVCSDGPASCRLGTREMI
jgi:hypothetical protein